MSYFVRLFTWWNRATLSTSLWTLVYGERVGEDEFGNVYYRTRGGKIDPALGFERRWVIYKGMPKAPIRPRAGMAGCITPSTRRPPRNHTRPRSGNCRSRKT